MFAGPADVYHFPNFILPPLRQGKSVVTIHDMSFLRFPEFAEERNRSYLSSRIRDTVNRADAVITDSRFSADEILDLMPADPENVFPIHLGIDHSFRRPDAREVVSTTNTLGLDRPYLLTVGTVEPRKNIPFLIEVFEKLADFDGYLVIAGMHGWKYEPILDRIRASARADRIHCLEYVEDTQLPALYTGAELFLLTSFYEGFGFPPLEAMACGTPVVSSTGGSLPEVLGGAAVLVDSFDSELWSGEISRLLSDTGAREQLAAEGARQAGKYSWDETARKTLEVYERVAG